MDTTELLLSRIQFAFTVSFHIIYPSFTIGLAAWLTVLEALHLATGRPAYWLVFEFWLKIFGLAFGLGVVSGIVMAFEFGTNWSELSKMSGPVQGPLLSYETFTALMLEATFFGVLVFGRPRVPPRFYLFSTAMVALGTTFSAFWIVVNNSWVQVPVGSDDLPRRLLRRLRLHIRLRHPLHLPAPAGWPWRLSGSATNRRSPQPAHVARQ
jgi:cytochrome d ubiquinol oxidase subunit I